MTETTPPRRFREPELAGFRIGDGVHHSTAYGPHGGARGRVVALTRTVHDVLITVRGGRTETTMPELVDHDETVAPDRKRR